MRYRLGSRVKISKAGLENDCYTRYHGKVLIITHIATNTAQHPGFDEGAGSPLYDLATEEGEPVPFSLYEWEIRKA